MKCLRVFGSASGRTLTKFKFFRDTYHSNSHFFTPLERRLLGYIIDRKRDTQFNRSDKQNHSCRNKHFTFSEYFKHIKRPVLHLTFVLSEFVGGGFFGCFGHNRQHCYKRKKNDCQDWSNNNFHSVKSHCSKGKSEVMWSHCGWSLSGVKGGGIHEIHGFGFTITLGQSVLRVKKWHCIFLRPWVDAQLHVWLEPVPSYNTKLCPQEVFQSWR